MTGLLSPPVNEAAFSDEDVAEQARRWRQIGAWSNAAHFARVLAGRYPHDVARLRDAAELSSQAGEDQHSARLYDQLDQAVVLDGSEYRRWVSSLIRLDAPTQALRALRRMELVVDSPPGALFVAQVYWYLARSTQDSQLAVSGWRAATAIANMPTVAAGSGAAAVGLEVVQLLCEMRSHPHIAAVSGSSREFVQTLRTVGAMDARALLVGAQTLVHREPRTALDLAEGVAPSAERCRVKALAYAALDDYHSALAEFDELEKDWGQPVADLPITRDERRSRCIALVEVGRLAQAGEDVERALRDLKDYEIQLVNLKSQPVAPGQNHEQALEVAEAGPTALWDVKRSYLLQRARLHWLLGEYRSFWKVIDDVLATGDSSSPTLQRWLALLNLLASPDAATAVTRFARLRALEREVQSHEPFDDTAFVEGCAWVAGRWDPEPPSLRMVRGQGQAAARELVERSREWGRVEQARRMVLAGDDLRALQTLGHEAAVLSMTWGELVLRSVLALRMGDDSRAEALLAKVMVSRRHDPDLRVAYAHACLLAGDGDRALRESISCVEAVPDHVMARVVKGECQFEMALRGDALRRGSQATTYGPDVDITTGEVDGARRRHNNAVENVEQLIHAVAEYRHALRLEAETRAFLASGSREAKGSVGSEVLPDATRRLVCRRGLHAAILAQEGIDSLGLVRDRTLERHAEELVSILRSHEHRCCADPPRTMRGRMLHRWHHIRDHDEPMRLARLMTAHRRGHWRRVGVAVLMCATGLALIAAVLTDHLPGTVNSDALRVIVLSLGVLMALSPLARNIKVAGFEIERREDAPPIMGRTKALRTSAALQRSLLTSGFTSLPVAPSRAADTPVPDREPSREAETGRNAVEGVKAGILNPKQATIDQVQRAAHIDSTSRSRFEDGL